MQTQNKAFGLTGNQLKLIAIVLMTIDHIGAYLLPQYVILRYIGRLAMPIFAWMIAEGCHYTKNRFRYLLTMLGFAAVRQVVYFVFLESLNQCILVTFSLSIILIYVMDHASKKGDFLSLCLMGGVFVAVAYICVLLPGDLPGTDFRVDYGLCGVLLPVFVYMGRTKQEKLLLMAAGLSVLANTSGKIQWFALPSVLLLALYNGQRGKKSLKYLFYIYYPLHLAVIYGVALLLR